MENVKDWLDKKGYHNSGLRTDRNHRIDLYLSDVLEQYRTELLDIYDIIVPKDTLVCEMCDLNKVENKGDWCNRCLEDAT